MADGKHPLRHIQSIAEEFGIPLHSVKATIELLLGGNTIPFIARYRKEATGNLDELQVKQIQERFSYLQELEERKQVILNSINSQGKLTDELRNQIISCELKTTLEDLYLPYKPKRRTRAMIAKEKGLEPLADLIIRQVIQPLMHEGAALYINFEKGVADVDAALAGARDIVAERVAENADVRAIARDEFSFEGIIVSKVRPDKVNEPSKFEQYYDFKEAVKTIPSHRYLAIRRGEREEILDFTIEIQPEIALGKIEKLFSLDPRSPFYEQLKQAIEDAFYRLLCPSIETDVRLNLKMASDRDAVAIFADNVKHLLLAPPMGNHTVLGVDPGIRTGCKCAVVDATGKFLASTTIFLSQGEGALQQARKELKQLIDTFQLEAIAIGNGTAGRETEAWVRKFIKESGYSTLLVVPVNESGASIYSASDVAREEFPDLDLTVRGAISIARRLQDPLAELVKVDPKSIGVGQYQHDVHQPLLQDELQHVVESCVNGVGVDLNTASSSLLTYVSGIGPTLAKRIVSHREKNGPFKSRLQLQNVAGFGPKTFEQAAGFLRIRGGENLLDASAVHPEQYGILEQMASSLKVSLLQLVGNPRLIEDIDTASYAKVVGEHTLADIIQELKKPGRDPRAIFEPPAFRDDVMAIGDLKIGMKLEGVVTNVTAFGAFVDIGVHQDGLVHLSELSDQYVKDPHAVVKAGDKIKVEVLQVDIHKKRISLTARIGEKRDKFVTPRLSSKDSAKFKPKQEKSAFSSNPFSALS